MNRSTLLAATADLSVSRFDHPPEEVHQDPDVEEADHWSVAFVEAGTFVVSLAGSRRRLSTGSVLLTRPAMAFRCVHEDSCPRDVCLSVRFEPAAIEGYADAWFRPGAMVQRRPSPRLAHVQRRLAGALGADDAFDTERWALAALDALVRDADLAPVRGWYAAPRTDLDAVIAVCEAIEAHPATRVSVADRARIVGMTSTTLTHAFRRYLGTAPHQYVVRWRLASAADCLDASCSVSESCYRAGFENLSHFCRTFQRHLGIRPSQWRHLSLPERRRKVQAMLRVGS